MSGERKQSGSERSTVDVDRSGVDREYPVGTFLPEMAPEGPPVPFTAPESYRTLVVDPPWRVKAGTLKGREGWHDANGNAADLKYPTMSLEEITALPVAKLAAPDAHLYLWTINRYLPAAFGVMRAWGFSYSTALVWAKTPMGGGLGGAWGISTEFLLFARRGSLPALGRVRGTWFNDKRPYDERGKPKGSSKPPAWQDRIETVSPGPYLEMFARERRDGWDAWGDEIKSDVEMVA